MTKKPRNKLPKETSSTLKKLDAIIAKRRKEEEKLKAIKKQLSAAIKESNRAGRLYSKACHTEAKLRKKHCDLYFKLNPDMFEDKDEYEDDFRGAGFTYP